MILNRLDGIYIYVMDMDILALVVVSIDNEELILQVRERIIFVADI